MCTWNTACELGKTVCLTYRIRLSTSDVKTPCLESHDEEQYGLPSLEELGHDLSCLQEALFPGGEVEALRRLEESMQRTVRWRTNGGLSNHVGLI